LDLAIEIVKGGKTFYVKKSRITGLPQGDSFPLSYDKFADIYGKAIIEKESEPVVMATSEDINTVKEFIEALNIPQENIDKWYKKCDVESFEEMTKDEITSLIDNLKSRVKKIGEK
jgi:hypothetical protein